MTDRQTGQSGAAPAPGPRAPRPAPPGAGARAGPGSHPIYPINPILLAPDP
jgi:hypothetical protein